MTVYGCLVERDDMTSHGDASCTFEVSVIGADPAARERLFSVTRVGTANDVRETREYFLADTEHNAYLDFFAALARDFGARMPRNRQPAEPPAFSASYRPLLTTNVSPGVRYGYGDPAVLRVDRDQDGHPDCRYYLLVTSNDAPDSFPILGSSDLVHWSLVSFVFPRGTKPGWAADGENTSDYWAPEMHHIGGEFRVYFAARQKGDGGLAIGVAKSSRPDGPFMPNDEPLLTGGVIDPHVLVDRNGTAYLLWKEDANDVWPMRLGELLYRHGDLIPELFESLQDRRTASLMQSLWPWVRELAPMERFFVQQVLIEAVSSRFVAFCERLTELRSDEKYSSAQAAIGAVLDVMRTRVYAQQLTPDGCGLVGARTLVFENDLEWEAHLVEGVWVSEHAGKYYLFYAGNDFSTAQYGIGVAIADSALGPYRKMDEPILRSTAEWSGPGHPSVATGLDGEPCLFFHAFHPGETGYKAFRALLAAPIAFEADRVVLK